MRHILDGIEKYLIHPERERSKQSKDATLAIQLSSR
jgi:hypothetical protein